MVMLIPGGSAANLHEFIKKTKWIVPAPFLHPAERNQAAAAQKQEPSARWGESWLTFGGGWAFRCAGSPLCPGCCGHRCISVCRCSCSEPLPSPAFARVGCSVLSFPLYLWFPTFPTIDAYAAETVKAYPLHTNWSPDFQRNCRLCILTDWRDNWK